MKYNLIIIIESKKISLVLQEEGKNIDTIAIDQEHQLSEKILPKIDKLLKRNNLSPRNIQGVALQSDMGDNFTTQRIAMTVKQTFNWVIAVDN